MSTNRCFRNLIPGRLAAISAVAVWLATSPVTLLGAEDAKAAGDKLQKITFDEHIRPIFRENCAFCHNQDDKEAGLAVDNFAALMEGGSSGKVLVPGDVGGSRLWKLINHEEEPFMAPDEDKLAADQLALIKKWIDGGVLENAGSKAMVKKKTSLALAAPSGTGRPENPAMPEGLPKLPVVHAERPGAITAIASSPWAPVLAVAGQKQIVLYHSDTGELLGVLPFEEGIPYVLRFSRNGSLLLAGGGRGAHSGYAVLYDLKTGRRLTRVGDELDVVLAADINDDQTRVALGGPQRIVRIYSTETGELLHSIKKHTDWIYAIRYSPDGVLLATADRSNGLFVWEADTAREYLNLRGHRGAVTDVAWRPDSNVLASASMDGTVKLWEMNEGKNVKSWNAHSGGVMCVNYTHDGRIATAGRDKTAKAWSGDGGLQKQFPTFPEIALEATFTHDGSRVAAGDWSGQVQMWVAADAKQVAELSPNPPSLAMLIEAATAKHRAAQAAAQKAQAELAAAQQLAAQKTTAAKAAADQAASSASAIAATETQRKAAAQAVEAAAAATKTASETLAVATENLKKAKEAKAEEAAIKAATDAFAVATESLKKSEVAKAEADKQLAGNTAAAKAATDKAAADKAGADKATAEKAESEAQLATKQAPAGAAQKELAAAKSALDDLAAQKTAADGAAGDNN